MMEEAFTPDWSMASGTGTEHESFTGMKSFVFGQAKRVTPTDKLIHNWTQLD